MSAGEVFENLSFDGGTVMRVVFFPIAKSVRGWFLPKELKLLKQKIVLSRCDCRDWSLWELLLFRELFLR